MSHPSPPERSPDPFSQCPSGCVCGVRELVAQAHDRGQRAAEDVDAAEMRALLTAVRSGYEAVRTDDRLPARREQANIAWARADRQLNTMKTMLDEQQLSQTATEVGEAKKAVVRGNPRPSWLRAIRWPVLVGIGLFDVYYFNQVFRYLTSQTGDAASGGHGIFANAWETLAAIVPGVALAIIIAASGEMLLRPLHAWKAAAFRKPDGSDLEGRGARALFGLGAIGRWMLRLAWRLLPVCFVITLLSVIGVWAGLRAKYVRPPSDGYPIASVMLLIVMLSLGAMAVKILAADPPSEKLAGARRELWRRRRIYLWHARKADRLIGDYECTWSDLRTLRDDLVGLLRVKMLSAWEGFVLRIRSLHRMSDNVTAHDQSDPEDRGLIHPEFEGVPQPQMELGALLEVCRLIEAKKPTLLRNRKKDLDVEYARQLTRDLPHTRQAELVPRSPDTA
jgi:hypothetical protein